MFTERIKRLNAWGVVYWNGPLYRTAMRFLRPSGERDQMLQRVAREIGSLSVLELCCGAGDLRRWIPGNAYRGVDKNPGFTDPLISQGVHVTRGDVLSMRWPEARCLVMIDSLYHFMPQLDALMDKMRLFPCEKVIISEPVNNLLPKLPPGLRGLARWATRVDGCSYDFRFTEEQLRDFFARYGFQKVTRMGANDIGVWEKHG
jgi:hypothetical protein